MKLEGGEKLLLKTLLDLQGEAGDYVDDARLAAATKMFVQDVRDWLETLEGKGLVGEAGRSGRDMEVRVRDRRTAADIHLETQEGRGQPRRDDVLAGPGRDEAQGSEVERRCA